MANLIQIKRSTTASTPGSLANGELAFTSNGDVLYIGSPNGSVVAIGGLRVPGFLTANQALVANTTGYLNEIRTANLVATKVYANGVFGTNGQVLTSNSTGGVFWNTPLPGVVGSNTQIQFNDSGSLGANPNLTFNQATSTLATVNVQANTVNAAVYTVGTDFVANSSAIVGANLAFIANSVGITSNTFVANNIGITGNTFVANNVGIFGNNFVANNAGIFGNSFIANSTGTFVTGTVNAATVAVGSHFSANTTRVVIGSNVALQANGGIGTPTQALLSNGSSVYWSDTVSSVATGNGLIGGTITTTGTLSVLANNGIAANSGGVYVVAGTGVTVNSTGVHIGQPVAVTDSVTFDAITATGNVIIGNNITDTVSFYASVNTDIQPSANITYDIGSHDKRWEYIWAANVHSARGYIEGNLQVGGDLIVAGNLVTTNVSSLNISDPLIFLAANNSNSDLVDIGFVGEYYDGANGRHTGVIRHAASDAYYIFRNYQPHPANNTIDINDPSFRLATTYLYINSGGLVTNATTVAITANSTVNVAIVANSISVSSPIQGNSGGTGISTVTNNAILVGNSTNGFNQLALGTSGYVLQSNGTALVYDILDGGTF